MEGEQVFKRLRRGRENLNGVSVMHMTKEFMVVCAMA